MRAMPCLASVILLVTLGTTLTANAQPPTAPRPGLPTAPADTGIPSELGILRGRVVDAQSGAPIDQAVITVTSQPDQPAGAPRIQFGTTTDSDGRYTVIGLRLLPGSYVVSARADDYMESPRGRLETGVGHTVEVRGGVITRAPNVPLWRAGVVNGRIFTTEGEGFPGVEIELLTERLFDGGRRLMGAGFAQTDSEGLFRVGGLAPGDYYVRAHTGRAPSRADTPVNEVYAPTYFPGSTDAREVQPLAIGPGQTLPGIEFGLVTVDTFTVTGTIVDTGGQPVRDAMLLVQPDPIQSTTSLAPPVPTTEDGQFEITNVLPGDYRLRGLDPARRLAGRAAPGTPVTVDEDVEDLLVVMPRGARVDGRIVSLSVPRQDGLAPPEPDPATLKLSIELRPGDGSVMVQSVPDPIRPDGAFSIGGVVGPAAIQVGALPPEWRVKSITLDNTDITFDAVDFGEGRLRQVEIVLTNAFLAPTSVFGNVTDRRGRAVADYTLVVFPENQDRLRPPSPFVKTAGAGQDGRYRVDELPPGDYLAVALEQRPEPGMRNPEVLERLWPLATPFRLDEGEQQVLDLRLARTPGGLGLQP